MATVPYPSTLPALPTVLSPHSCGDALCSEGFSLPSAWEAESAGHPVIQKTKAILVESCHRSTGTMYLEVASWLCAPESSRD
ncbi:hypothetical protein DPEC_G00117320 [Dallia pectoralis]|uniref:Uncharacterized protein n=1 Tax=Dallia pectoralis TaxID=75939 RepID=A0ACC2GUT4_DALPE|nr:hypothetical protein DPEC_G00117320 [Dallia pectoralis]